LYEPGLAGVGEKREGWRESTHLADRALIGGGGSRGGGPALRSGGTRAKGARPDPRDGGQPSHPQPPRSAREGECEREGEEGRERARGRG